MIEWIQHWDEMRFYYWSGLSWIMILPVYVAGVLLLGLLWWWLAKVWKKAWIVIIAMLPVLAIAPWWEELSIAWNFGQLCKKDAGSFIYKTVEVEGFYDDTTHWWRQLAESDYQFVESREYGTTSLWRVERDGTELKHFKIDHPTARYHYRTLAGHKAVAHQVDKFENIVVDSQTNEVLGRYLNYYRGAPWFFVGLDRPTIPCRETERDTRKYGTISVYALTLSPDRTRRDTKKAR